LTPWKLQVIRISVPTSLGHPVSYVMATSTFPGLKQPRRGVDHPLSSSAKVKDRVELFLYSSPGSSWPVLGQTFFTFTSLVANSSSINTLRTADADLCF